MKTLETDEGVNSGTIKTLVEWGKRTGIPSGKNELFREVFNARVKGSYAINPETAQKILEVFERDMPDILVFSTAIKPYLERQINKVIPP